MMRNILFFSILIASSLSVSAQTESFYPGPGYSQTPEAALRYSWLQNTGTARSQGIANANGAIGGEISTIFSNPANIGFYKTGDFVITGGLNLLNNDATYYGATNKANKTSGFLGTTGFVLGKPNYNGGSMKSSAFGIAINRTADFNNRIVYQNGQKVNSSMADYFIDETIANNGLTNKFGSDLAFQSYWYDTLNGDFVSSASSLAKASGIDQKQTITTNGGITELAIAGAGNINDRFYFGGTIGFPIIRYGAHREFTEQDPDANDASNDFDVAYFDDDLTTKGIGVNIKAGIVFKATENFRLGFAAHSPTFYSLTDRYYSEAGTALENYVFAPNRSYVPDVAPDEDLIFDYNLQTPYKLMGSFSLLFGNVNDVSSQKGFLSGDVEYVNYMASTFRNTSDNKTRDNEFIFKNLNNSIDDYYKGAVNARLGAELKFNPIMVRLGGAYYGNPYKNKDNAEGQLVQATGGLGYRNQGFFIDLGYVHTFGKDVIYPYRSTYAPVNPANIKNKDSRIVLTLGFKI